jgi:TRAP-type C4-dicarboxylate transport system permease large subunit
MAEPKRFPLSGAFMAALIGFLFGRLTWVGIMEALKNTIRTSAMIFMILIGATIFGYYMALSRVPQHVVAVITEMNLNRWVVIIGIVVGYFVISMVMDEIPLLLITLPLSFPLVTSVGFDPIWFGVSFDMMEHGARVSACRDDCFRGQCDGQR